MASNYPGNFGPGDMKQSSDTPPSPDAAARHQQQSSQQQQSQQQNNAAPFSHQTLRGDPRTYLATLRRQGMFNSGEGCAGMQQGGGGSGGVPDGSMHVHALAQGLMGQQMPDPSGQHSASTVSLSGPSMGQQGSQGMQMGGPGMGQGMPMQQGSGKAVNYSGMSIFDSAGITASQGQDSPAPPSGSTLQVSPPFSGLFCRPFPDVGDLLSPIASYTFWWNQSCGHRRARVSDLFARP